MSDKTAPVQIDLSQPRTPRQYLRLFFSGFAMGSADVVPGVSGGTMAFILGVYETLINGIKSFNIRTVRLALRFDIKGIFEQIPVRFFLALGLGLASAVLLLANLLHDLLENQPTFIFAFFAGLILASILAINVKVKWSPQAAVALVVAALFAFFLVGIDTDSPDPVGDLLAALASGEGVAEAEAELVSALQANDAENIELRIESLKTTALAGLDTSEIEESLAEDVFQPSQLPTLFFSGMIAICAMLLPGISGSFILLILGQYAAALGAVRNFDIVSIAALGAGAVIGIIVFSRVISWLLKHYQNVTIAALVGFMVGSLRLIWMEAAKGVDVVSETGALDGGQWALALGLLLFGFLLVSLLDHLQSRSNPVFALFWHAPKADVGQQT